MGGAERSVQDPEPARSLTAATQPWHHVLQGHEDRTGRTYANSVCVRSWLGPCGLAPTPRAAAIMARLADPFGSSATARRRPGPRIRGVRFPSPTVGGGINRVGSPELARVRQALTARLRACALRIARHLHPANGRPLAFLAGPARFRSLPAHGHLPLERQGS